MSTTVKAGWLKDNQGNRFAPKTLSSQVMTIDGISLEEKIYEDLDKIAGGTVSKAESAIKDGNGNVIVSTYETKTDAQNKYNELKGYTDTNFALKTDLDNINLTNYETTANAQAKLEEAKQYADTVASGKSDSTHKHDDLYDAKGTAESKANAVQANLDTTNSNLNTHVNNTDIHFTAAERTKLSGIADGATNYVHPETAGNKHIPSGGSNGQVLGWDSDGTGKWIGIEDLGVASKDDIGNLENLETSNKSDLVVAINEVRNAVSAGGTESAITMSTSTTTEGALKSYTIKQGSNTIGTIDIPKDMVVTSGEVVTDPAGLESGTYIKLVLANVADPLYINVGSLVDIYKAKASATQIQIAIDSSTREISATIVAGSVGSTELADNAVTTVKIVDGNVTLAKLSTTVQSSLAKADSAVQNIAEGTSNGTISVDGTDVKVKGLGSAAYTDSSAYDVSGAAEEAFENAKSYTDESLNNAVLITVEDIDSICGANIKMAREVMF